ncbi:MAG: Protein involved in cellulose biosynthesis (CelD)-like protein [Deltaproteobacteria bacterium]|nr:Protein involved in cellulose biosynthesis (CelD)-like protein [Deltaproteobacteria bacterium]
MLFIEEIADVARLKSLANKWNNLLSQSESDNIFLTWEWVFNWWQVYGNRKELRVLVVRDHHEDIVAIAPFYVHAKRFFNSLSVKEVRFLGTGEDVSPDYLDFIIKKGFEHEAIHTLVEYLAVNDGWDVVNLTDMLSTSITAEVIRKVAADKGLKVEKSERAICPYIRLLPNWDEYMRSLSSNMRFNLKRRMRILEKDFRARYFIWQDMEGLEYAMERLSSLHHKRWEEKGAEHSFSSEQYNAFHQMVAREFALKGWLQLSCLELNDEIVAVLYDYRYGNKIYYYQGGFDPSLYKYSPGLVLRAYVIQKAIKDGIEEIDLLKGGYEHKYKWTQFDRQTINVTIGKNTLKSRIFFVDSFGKPRMKAAIKKVLPKVLLEMVRRARKVG